MKRLSKLVSVMVVGALLGGFVPPGPLSLHAQASEDGRKTIDADKTLVPPKIDGRLDEPMWSVDKPLGEPIGDGPHGDSRFGMMWDNNYLYIGVQAEDDTLISGSSGYWFDQDSIHLFFDPTMHRSAPFAESDMQIGFVYRPDSSTPEFHFGAALNNHSGKDEKSILRAIRTTPEGWSFEAAIPWSMLDFDPQQTRQLGVEIGVTDRFDAADAAKQRSSFWSAFNTTSFWNDTSGYGVVRLKDEAPLSGDSDPVLLEESFDGYAPGTIPPGWISDVNAGSHPFTVTQDTYGNGRLTFDGSASGKQGRIVAPVQWDNYAIEADVRFESVLNSARWASLMFRVPSEGKPPYNQMAVRQNGAYEIAYRKPDGNWSVPASGNWSQPLALNEDYTLKVRVYGNNVKEYIKAKDDPDYTLLTDKSLTQDLLARGKVGFQADQSKVSFDNLKVTRITAERLDVALPDTVEALSGPISVTGSVYYSDGVTESVYADKIRLYSSDPSIIHIVDDQVVPLRAGTATVKAVYDTAESARPIEVTPSATGPKVVSIKHEIGHAFAVAGEPVDLNALTFQATLSDYTTASLPGSQLSWTSASPGATIDGGVATATGRGVYKVAGQLDGAAVEMLLFVKEQTDAEYVLYEESFDSVPNGTMPDGWMRIQGSTASKAAVYDGAFVLDAGSAPDNPSRVLLPDYLGRFGNYVIEADVTHAAANDSARWNSIMYRIQNDNYPYYQMAVRQNAAAANGVEFAERTPTNQWNVMERGSHTEPIDANRMYRYTIKAYDYRVQEWIDDRLVIDTEAAFAYTTGRIGLQADGSRMKVDRIRVTLLETPLPGTVKQPFVEVAQPETRISLAPSIATEIGSPNDLAKWSGASRPATVILRVDNELNVRDAAGQTEIGKLDEVLAAIGSRMIPAFYISDGTAADRLADYLFNAGIEDAFVVSADGDLIKQARSRYPMLRGIVDFTSATDFSREGLLDIRRKTSASQAKIALLPQSAATPGNVSYLQQRTIVVWAKDASAPADKEVALHTLITAGVNGIVTGAPDAAREALKLYSHETTLVRKPYIIGHRGMPSTSPENTIESNELALDSGADFIENDMFLSKDGYIVISHSSDLSVTTNGTGSVENYTLEELKRLNANKPYPNGYTDVKIPTLDEQIELAKKRGRMVYAEIKTQTPAAVQAFVDTIKRHDAEDLINAMSFYPEQLSRLAALMPEMPAGLLTGYIASESNVEPSLRQALKTVQSLNLTFNTDYNGLGKRFMEAANHRGLIVSPWTINEKADLVRLFKLGAFGLTTDYAYWAENWAVSVEAERNHYVLEQGTDATVSAFIKTYKLEKSKVAPEIVLLDGQDVVDASGSVVTAKKPGTAHALLRYTATIEDKGIYEQYDLYTQPITFEVKGQDGGNDDGGSDGGGSDDGNDDGDSDDGGSDDGGSDGGGSDDGGSDDGGSDDGDSDDGSSGGNGSGGSSDSSGSGGSGGSSKPGGPAQSAAIIVATGGKADAAELKKAFETSPSVEIRFDGDVLEIPAAAWTDGARSAGGTLTAKGESAAYRIPASAWKPEDWAAELGADAGSITLRVTIRKLAGDDARAAEAALSLSGGRPLTDIVLFEAEAASADGKSVPVSFGPAVTRVLALGTSVDPAKATGVQLFPDSGRIRFVPTVFRTENGQTVAELKRGGDGIYAIVANDRSFADMDGHWAKSDVEQLANKLLIDGVDADRFDPERGITRAEFAALLSRALGLNPAGNAAASFRDVTSDAWYAEEVEAAAAAGLIDGYEDGSFLPDRLVNREELAAMLVRALAYAGVDTGLPAEKRQTALERFRDAPDIVWANDEIAYAVASGLMDGTAADTLDARGTATRAQAAVMLKRFLQQAGLL